MAAQHELEAAYAEAVAQVSTPHPHPPGTLAQVADWYIELQLESWKNENENEHEASEAEVQYVHDRYYRSPSRVVSFPA